MEIIAKPGTALEQTIKAKAEEWEVKICLFVFGRNQGPYFTGEFDYNKED